MASPSEDPQLPCPGLSRPAAVGLCLLMPRQMTVSWRRSCHGFIKAQMGSLPTHRTRHPIQCRLKIVTASSHRRPSHLLAGHLVVVACALPDPRQTCVKANAALLQHLWNLLPRGNASQVIALWACCGRNRAPSSTPYHLQARVIEKNLVRAPYPVLHIDRRCHREMKSCTAAGQNDRRKIRRARKHLPRFHDKPFLAFLSIQT